MPANAPAKDNTSHPKVRDNDARGAPAGQATTPQPHGGAIGQPPFNATDEQREKVMGLVKAGLTQDQIALLLAVSRETIKRHFRHELDIGNLLVGAAIGASLTQKALNGNLTAQIFWLRTRMKWNVRVEHVGPDGGPIKTFDFSQLSLEEKRALLPMLEQILIEHGEGEDGDSRAGGAIH